MTTPSEGKPPGSGLEQETIKRHRFTVYERNVVDIATEEPVAPVLERLILEERKIDKGLCIWGPPGSGKTTFLMQMLEKIEGPLRDRGIEVMLLTFDNYLARTERRYQGQYGPTRSDWPLQTGPWKYLSRDISRDAKRYMDRGKFVIIELPGVSKADEGVSTIKSLAQIAGFGFVGFVPVLEIRDNSDSIREKVITVPDEEVDRVDDILKSHKIFVVGFDDNMTKAEKGMYEREGYRKMAPKSRVAIIDQQDEEQLMENIEVALKRGEITEQQAKYLHMIFWRYQLGLEALENTYNFLVRNTPNFESPIVVAARYFLYSAAKARGSGRRK